MADTRHALEVERTIAAPAEAVFDTFIAMYDSERPDWVTDSTLAPSTETRDEFAGAWPDVFAEVDRQVS